MIEYTITEKELKELCDSLRKKFSDKARKTGSSAFNRAGDMAAQIVSHQVKKIQTQNQPDLNYDQNY